MSSAPTQFRRINPYPGLMVDVDVWRDAHDYHRDQLHLHHLALHGWGIVQGLDISLVEGSEHMLRIAPGLAVDPAGNFIGVPQAQSYQITSRERQTVYLVLQLREVLAEPASPTAGNRASPLTRVLEAFRLQERDRLPEEAYVELARIEFRPDGGPIRMAADPEAPKVNELDLRARVRLGSTLTNAVRSVSADGQAGPDGLAPRVDSLREQVSGLNARVDQLAQGPVHRLDELSGEVHGLAERLGQLANEVAALQPTEAAEPGSAAIAARLEALAQQVEELAQRASRTSDDSAAPDSEHLEDIGRRLDDIAQHLDTLEGREPAGGGDTAELVSRVEALARQVDALAEQVGSAAPGAASAPQTAGVSELAERLDALAQQVAVLDRGGAAADAEAGATPGGDNLAQRLDALAQQIESQVQRLNELAGREAGGPAADVAGRVEELAQQVAAVRERASEQPPLSAELNGRFEELDGRTATLTSQIEATARQVAGLEQRSGGETVRLDDLTLQVDALRRQCDGLEQRTTNDLDGRLSSVAQRVAELAQQVESLQRTPSTPDDLSQRVDALRHELDASSLQLQALARQLDAAPSPTPGLSAPLGSSAPAGQSLQVALAEHAGQGWDAHRDGLRWLAREARASTDFAVQSVDAVRLGDQPQVDVLYLSGHGGVAFDEQQVDAIRRVLDGGGVVIGEGCAAGPSGETGQREFAMAFVNLANQLQRQLTRVDRSHAVMHARHVFGEPPPGARPTPRVLESGGMVYSDADYGCAWQGGPPTQALPRATIRDALEFGTNLTIFRRNGT